MFSSQPIKQSSEAPKKNFLCFLKIFQISNLSFESSLTAKIASIKDLQLEPKSLTLKEIEVLYFEVFSSNKHAKLCSLETKRIILTLITMLEVLLQKPPESFHESDWTFMASMIPNISVFALKHLVFSMFRMLKSSLCRQSHWNVELDELLLLTLAGNCPFLFSSMAVSKQTNVKWSHIALELCRKIKDIRMFKTDKQCKERWLNHLQPFLNKKAWSLDEDLMLLEESLKNQNKWSEIAKKLIGRTQHAVKNRFICVLGRSLQLSIEKIRDSIKKKEAWKWALASLEVLKCEKKEATTKNFQ